MASIDLPSSTKKRSMNAEVNLVPFIDLLSVCICFLLMTAVWVQLGMMEVKQTQGTVASSSQKDPFEVDLKFEAQNSARITLKRKGRNFRSVRVKSADQTDFLNQVDKALASMVTKAGGTIANAIITPKNGVNYGDMIQVMDVLRSNKIVNLGVVPIGKGSR